MGNGPRVVASGRIVQSEPAAFATLAAAVFCGCSPSWLTHERAADVKRLERGEPMIGPRWVLLPYGVRYLRSDLDAWLASSAVPLAVLQSARRTKAAP